ncbi:MAG: hypothetical protein GAK44_00313 [Pseudomonas delhiensis]|nr:MAG: hypothetical protein GAK44_00313 [Pseudomonas delhiensis]
MRQRAVDQQLVIDLDLVGDAQAVRHLDDVDPVEEGLVVLVVAEAVPFRFVGVGEDDTAVGQCAEALGAVVVALLGGGEQGVQDLDRCLEHLDEFHQALVGPAQCARVAVGVGVVLRVFLEFADVDLADQGGDVLVVLVTRFGLGHGDLVEDRRVQFDHAELADVATEFVEALGGPGRHDRAQVAARNAVVLFEDRAVFVRVEQPEGRFEDRRALDGVERDFFDQLLELLGQRRLAAAHRAQQVDDLFLLFQALGGVAEEGDDLVDALFHAMEVGERRVTANDLVGENTRQPWIGGGVQQLRLADGHQHALCGTGVGGLVLLADVQVLLKGVFLLTGRFEAFLEVTENTHDVSSLDAWSRPGIGSLSMGAVGLPVIPARIPQNSNGTWLTP